METPERHILKCKKKHKRKYTKTFKITFPVGEEQSIETSLLLCRFLLFLLKVSTLSRTLQTASPAGGLREQLRREPLRLRGRRELRSLGGGQVGRGVGDTLFLPGARLCYPEGFPKVFSELETCLRVRETHTLYLGKSCSAVTSCSSLGEVCSAPQAPYLSHCSSSGPRKWTLEDVGFDSILGTNTERWS